MILMFSVVILCAGDSSRFELNGNKTLLPLFNMPVFMNSVKRFQEFTDDIIVVCKYEEKDMFLAYYDNVISGGKTRTESAYLGVFSAKYDKVFIHDGARPYVDKEDIIKLIEVSKDTDLAFLGSTLVDSIKDENYNNLAREKYFLAYTPQYVKREDYIYAYNKREKEYSDDVSLIQGVLGKKPVMVNSNRHNIKITTLDDYLFLSKYQYRIGHSLDIHRLVENRKLILGGVNIPYELGLLGHSDADACLHALSEAFLGALALGDLGHFYPDDSENTKDMDSKIILKECYQRVLDNGYKLANADIMIYAEKPKLSPYIDLMRESISSILGVNKALISIKATTAEKLGVIGEGKAIASEATVLIQKEC